MFKCIFKSRNDLVSIILVHGVTLKRIETMPTCCIKNCTSRTHNNGTKGLKYFTFPKNVALREQWLNACQKKETDMKIDSARICSLHFDKDCFLLKKTQPRSKNTPVKEIVRLKKESIPTKMLILEKKRKRTMSQKQKNKEDNKRVKILSKSCLPTYEELVQYAQEKQLSHDGKNLETDIANMNVNMEQSVNMKQPVNMEQFVNMKKVQKIEKQNELINQKIIPEIDNNLNVSIETLLQQLKKSEEEKQKLLEKTINLEQKNQDLNIKIMQLQTEVIKLAKDTKKHKKAEAIAIKTMKKVFTPRQIKMLREY